MSETLASTAAALRDGAAALDDLRQRLGALEPGAAAFGVIGPGSLGELGRDLHARWQRAIDARVREAGQHAARLGVAADAVAAASARYTAAEAGAAHTHRPGEGS